MQIPIHFLGEEEAVGVKIGGGSVSRLMTEIEVSCFPKDLPEFLEVDISELELDQMLYVSNISLPKGVEVSEILLEQDQAIVSIHEIKEIIEEEIIDEEGDADGESTDDQAAAESSGEESSDDSSDTSDSDKSEG